MGAGPEGERDTVATSQSLRWQQLLGLVHPRGGPGKGRPSFPAHPNAGRGCAQGRSTVGRRQHAAAPKAGSCCHPCTKRHSQSGVLRCCIAGWEPWACGGLAGSWHRGSGRLRWAKECQGQKWSEFIELQRPDVIDYLPPKRGVFYSFLNNCRDTDIRSGGDEVKVGLWLKALN